MPLEGYHSIEIKVSHPYFHKEEKSMSTKSAFVRLASLLMVLSVLLAACAPAATAEPQVITNTVVVTATAGPVAAAEPVEITYYTFSAAPEH